MKKFITILIMMVPWILFAGTTGKISGVVTDKETGEPLPGVNVTVEGTNYGAATNLEGQYSIINVPPGTFKIAISMMGYSKMTITEIRVIIDQTAYVNAKMELDVLEGETVTIVAEKSIIKEDVATSVSTISSEEVQELPVSSIENVVSLQAGVQSGLQIRGGGADEALFLLDGVALRDPRNNEPISSIALSSVKDITIERGGFNAEYGQVRSGIVNVVTREGDKNSYYGNIEFKYSPPGKKYFGISPFDQNSNWLRPFYDNDVCWTGTSGEGFDDANGNQFWDAGESYTDINGDGQWTGWDKYTQIQYPKFEGWNAVSEALLSDSDPTNDLTPLGAQRVFMYETRKQPDYDEPDYDIDAGFGGPVPFISEQLGNLRFFTTYRHHREMLVVPLSRDDYVDHDWSLKLISDLTPSMKLMFTSLVGKKYTMQQNWSYYYLRYGGEIVDEFNEELGALFGTGYYSLSDIGHKNFSAKLTHTLSSQTFYEINIDHFIRDYHTRPTDYRDKNTLYEIVDGYYADEAPFNYDPEDQVGISGMLFGGFTCKRRDNTQVSSTSLKADITSQLNFNNLMKAGLEFSYNNLDFDYGTIANYTDSRWDEHVDFVAQPLRASMYVQDKLETKGFIMNAGLRLDYSNSNTEWWDVDPYDNIFFTSKYDPDGEYNMTKAKPQWQFSPRLSISHPITENSKLFFNYGHFKQMPSYERLFQIGRSSDSRLQLLGDPNLTLAKTISYELGYDHALFNDYLFQVSAFYHDIFDQQNLTQYISTAGISYNRTTSNSYEDVRGVELTLRKNRGRWWTFFGNYTYQVTTSGHFGAEEINQDPKEQRQYMEKTSNLYQLKPVPRPYARLNLTLFTPNEFGPRILNSWPLADYSMNFLVNWQAGSWTTWNPKAIESIVNNVQQTDYFNTVLRFGKTFHLNKIRLYAFVDVNNLFNNKRMSLRNFGGTDSDFNNYRDSLHLPSSKAYDNIPGDDRIGTYRKQGVDYQPMIGQGVIDYETFMGETGVIYYDMSTERYVQYVDDAWVDVEKGRLDQVLDDKAYIDMPNQDSFTFLNPRQIFFGIRLSFDLD